MQSANRRKVVLGERKLDAGGVVLWNHYVLPAGASFLKLERVHAIFFSLFFWRHLRLPLIKVRGVVCGRNCSSLWLLDENCGVTSCPDIIQGILVQDMHSRESVVVQGLQIDFTKLQLNLGSM